MVSKVAVFAGIGRQGVPVAERLVDEGWKLAISYREGRGSQKTVDKIVEDLGDDKVLAVNASIVEEDEAKRFIQEAYERYGRIDALISIASGFPKDPSVRERWKENDVRDEDWDYYNSNFVVTRNVCLEVLSLKDNPVEDLIIINFGDVVSAHYRDEEVIDPYQKIGGIMKASVEDIKKIGLKQIEKIAKQRKRESLGHTNPYILAKRDVGYLTRTLAVEYQGGNVRVNGIDPGPMEAPPDKSEKESQPVVDATLLKRWGGTSPIEQAVYFFLDNTFVTGNMIPIDGGSYLADLSKRAE